MARNNQPRSAAVQETKRAPGAVRIIAGTWRGRRIPVPESPGLRPTPDRVRETLYNWLQGRVAGRRVLDLYAGTGALGFEAASRGALHVTFVERDPRLAEQLRAVARTLGATGVEVRTQDAEAFVSGASRPAAPYDLVLLDPPFATGVTAELCTLLDTRGWLADGAFVYLESAAGQPLPAFPAGWQVLRELTAGAVAARLVRRRVPTTENSTGAGPEKD